MAEEGFNKDSFDHFDHLKGAKGRRRIYVGDVLVHPTYGACPQCSCGNIKFDDRTKQWMKPTTENRFNFPCGFRAEVVFEKKGMPVLVRVLSTCGKHGNKLWYERQIYREREPKKADKAVPTTAKQVLEAATSRKNIMLGDLLMDVWNRCPLCGAKPIGKVLKSGPLGHSLVQNEGGVRFSCGFIGTAMSESYQMVRLDVICQGVSKQRVKAFRPPPGFVFPVAKRKKMEKPKVADSFKVGDLITHPLPWVCPRCGTRNKQWIGFGNYDCGFRCASIGCFGNAIVQAVCSLPKVEEKKEEKVVPSEFVYTSVRPVL
jgi:hypothetical protein